MADLVSNSPEFRVNTTTEGAQLASDIAALAAGGYGFVWESLTAAGFRQLDYAIDLALFSPWGTQILAETELASVVGRFGGFREPSITQTADGSLVTLFGAREDVQSFATSSILGRTLDPNAVLTSFTLAGPTRGVLTPDLAARSAGGFAATWGDSSRGFGIDVRAGAYSPLGATITAAQLVDQTDTGSNYPATVARLSDGRFITAWVSAVGSQNDARARFLDANGAPVGSEFQLAGLGVVSGEVALAALPGGGFVAAWTAFGDTLTDVRARAFNAVGGATTLEFTVGAVTQGDQSDPSIAALSDGSFAIAWSDARTVNEPLAATDILLQRYSAAGVALGDEILVHANTDGRQYDSALAANTDGTLAVSWTDQPTSDAFGADIRARILTLLNAIEGTIAGETLTGTGAAEIIRGFGGNDTIFGLGGDDTLEGGTGDDIISGGDGDDLVDPGPGVDNSNGNLGVNTITYARSDSAVSIDLAAGTVTENGVVEQATFFQNAIGSAFGDLLRGDNGPNRLDGGGGDDVLLGLDGDDTLLGGAGDDILRPSQGRNSSDGGSGRDTVDFSTLPDLPALIIDLNAGAVFNGTFAQSIANIENAIGTFNADTIFGSETVANVIDGGPGADTLYGGGDAGDIISFASQGTGVIIDMGVGLAFNGSSLDRFSGFEGAIGTAGDDQLFGTFTQTLDPGERGFDIIVDAYMVAYDSNFSNVIIDLNVQRVFDGFNVDRLSGVANARGSRFDDDIFGSMGDNIIDGGAGFDRLLGEAGNDLFVMRRGEADGDIIRDFIGNGAAQGDRIQLVGYSPGSTFTPLQGNCQLWLVTDAVTGLVDAIRIVGAVHSTDYFFG